MSPSCHLELPLARSARVRATESKSGCSHRACGNRQAWGGGEGGQGGDVGVEGWDEEGHWGGCTPFCQAEARGLGIPEWSGKA